MDGGLFAWAAVSTAVVPVAPIEELIEEARAHSEHARASATLRAYAHDWQDFEAWCAAHGVPALPAGAGTLCLYFTERARRLKVSSLGRRLAAISVAHVEGGFEELNPTRSGQFKKLWRGLRRAKGTAVAKKAAIFTPELRRMSEGLPAHRLAGIRNRALLLVGFAGAFRRSELVGLDVEDLAFVSEGLVITLRHSKTDQEGLGATVPLPYGSNPETCPVRAMRRWLEVSGIAAGAVFRPVTRSGKVRRHRLSGSAVPLIVRAAARAAGVDATRLSAHSLRAGFASTAAAEDVPERDAMEHMRQRSVSVHRGYVRAANLFKRNPAARLGL